MSPTLTREEEEAAAALAGDGTVPEVAAGPAQMRTADDPEVRKRNLERLERLEKAGAAPDPGALDKINQPWQAPKRKAKDPPSELADHNLGALSSDPVVLESWGGKAVKGRVVFALRDEFGNEATFEMSPPHARDLSNRLLAWAAKALGQLQGTVPDGPEEGL